MATTATQATGTSPFQGKFGTGGANTGTSADGLGNAFLSNSAIAPVNVPTIGAPSFGSMSGGLNLMPMPTSLGVTPVAAPAAPVAPTGKQPGPHDLGGLKNYRTNAVLTDEEKKNFKGGMPRFLGGR